MSKYTPWDKIAVETDRYYVSGGATAHHRAWSVWVVRGEEVGIRVRRKRVGNMGWQFYTTANARLGGATKKFDAFFPEFLDVRCPTADDDLKKF